MPSLPGITGEQESTRASPTGEPGRVAAKLLDTRSTRGDDMPEIEVGDLVRLRSGLPWAGHAARIYLVVEIEKCALRDIPSWCKLHDDDDRLTAVKALTVVQKGSQ